MAAGARRVATRPATERRVHRLPARPEVAGDAGDPGTLWVSLGVQLDDGVAPVGRVEHVGVARIAAPSLLGCGTGGEDALDGVGAGTPARGDEADLGDLPQPEGRVLRLQVDDQLAQRRGEAAAILGTRRLLVGEEAGHADLIEAPGLAPEGPLRGLGLLGALDRGAAEEDDGAEQLVGELLGPVDEQGELLPVLGGGHLGTGTARHRDLSGRGGMGGAGIACASVVPHSRQGRQRVKQ